MAADLHVDAATEQPLACLQQTNGRDRDFRAPHKQIHKAFWEMSSVPGVGTPLSIGFAYDEYYISRQAPPPVSAGPAGCVGANGPFSCFKQAGVRSMRIPDVD